MTDEYGYRWTNHRDGSTSTPVISGAIETKAKIKQDKYGYSPSIHGRCLENTNAVPGKGEYGFLTKYYWPTLEEAKAAIRAITTPR